jgi:hypothetical protein
MRENSAISQTSPANWTLTWAAKVGGGDLSGCHQAMAESNHHAAPASAWHSRQSPDGHASDLMDLADETTSSGGADQSCNCYYGASQPFAKPSGALRAQPRVALLGRKEFNSEH